MEAPVANHLVFNNKDIIFCIARQLPPAELCLLAQVNKVAARVASMRVLWEPMCFLALSTNKVHRKIIQLPGFAGYVSSPFVLGHVINRTSTSEVGPEECTWRDVWSLLTIAKRRAPNPITCRHALRELSWFVLTKDGPTSLLTTYLNCSFVAPATRSSIMKGIDELRAKQDERANERISAWLRDVVRPDNEGTTWELRMGALALLGQSIESGIDAQRQLRSFIEKEPQKRKLGFTYSASYDRDLQNSLTVNAAPGAFAKAPLPLHVQWMQLVTPGTPATVDSLNSTHFAGSSLTAFLLRSLSAKQPDEPRYKQAGLLTVVELLWHCCTLGALGVEFPMAQLLSAEIALELEVDEVGPAHTMSVNVYMDCFAKHTASDWHLPCAILTSLIARPKSGEVMKWKFRSEIDLRLNDSQTPASPEYRVRCMPLLHRLGVEITFGMMQPYLDPHNPVPITTAWWAELPPAVRKIFEEELADGPRLETVGWYGLYGGWRRDGLRCKPNGGRKATYVFTEAKGKVMLPPQYVKFRQLLVQQGIPFSESRQCCTKGLGFDFALRTNVRNLEYVDVSLSPLAICGAVFRRAHSHVCRDWSDVAPELVQKGSAVGSVKRLVELMHLCDIPCLPPALCAMRVPSASRNDKTVDEFIFGSQCIRR